jgi:hypothetical protein
MTRNKYPLFDPGQCVATPGAIEAFQRAKQSPLEFLRRHIRGDWGELPAPDKEENEIALEHGCVPSSGMAHFLHSIWPT